MSLTIRVHPSLDCEHTLGIVRAAYQSILKTEGPPKHSLTIFVGVRRKRSLWTWRKKGSTVTITLRGPSPLRCHLNRAAYTSILYGAYGRESARKKAFIMSVPRCDRENDPIPLAVKSMKPKVPVQVRRHRLVQARVLRLENEIDELTGKLLKKRRALAAAEKKLRYYEKMLGGDPKVNDPDGVFADKMRRRRTEPNAA